MGQFLNVEVGQVNLGIGQTSLYEPDLQEGATIWTDYTIFSRFEKKHHKYNLGLTSPGGYKGRTTATCQTANPVLLWICEWMACRSKEKPIVPSKDPCSDDWELLDDHYEPAMMKAAADGVTPVWMIRGVYVYAHKNPTAEPETYMNFPRPPWLREMGDRALDSDMFADDLIC